MQCLPIFAQSVQPKHPKPWRHWGRSKGAPHVHHRGRHHIRLHLPIAHLKVVGYICIAAGALFLLYPHKAKPHQHTEAPIPIGEEFPLPQLPVSFWFTPTFPTSFVTSGPTPTAVELLPKPAPVPEPGSLLLLATGLLVSMLLIIGRLRT